MQGRIDVMKMMMSHDQNDTIATALNKEDSKKPPSLLHLSVANDFIECAEWYDKYYKFGNFCVIFISQIFYFRIIKFNRFLNLRECTSTVYKACSNSLLARTLNSQCNKFVNIS